MTLDLERLRRLFDLADEELDMARATEVGRPDRCEAWVCCLRATIHEAILCLEGMPPKASRAPLEPV